MKALNLGCGDRYLSGWVNVDFNSNSPSVTSHNLLTSLPFPDNEFDVVYSSHVLEHFTVAEAKFFLSEIFRVLKPGGLLRIVVPDLERFVTGYLDALKSVRNEKTALNQANHEWSVIELLDQMVRTRSGGEMIRLWSRDQLENEDYIEERLGFEFRRYRDFIKNNPGAARATVQEPKPFNKRSFRIKKAIFRKLFNLDIDPEDIFYLRFRKMGELHKWMYDEVSLGNLMTELNFRHPTVLHADTSNIPNWEENKFLDIENGIVRKPDSLFMEAVK